MARHRANRVRVDGDFSATPLKAKIADAEQTRVHTMLVIGGRNMEAGADIFAGIKGLPGWTNKGEGNRLQQPLASAFKTSSPGARKNQLNGPYENQESPRRRCGTFRPHGNSCR